MRAPPLISQSRARPADAVAEHEVQPPADLVDEVVHVALVAAVVVAREDDAGLVVEEDPAREVDRLHAREIAAREDVPAGDSRSARAARSRSQRRNRPGLTAPSAVNWLVTSWSSSSLQRLEVRAAAGAGRSRDRSSRACAAGRRTAAAADDQERQGDDADQRNADQVARAWRSASRAACGCGRGQRRAGPRRPRPSTNATSSRRTRCASARAASGPRGTFAASARCSALSSRICRTVRPTQFTIAGGRRPRRAPASRRAGRAARRSLRSGRRSAQPGVRRAARDRRALRRAGPSQSPRKTR